MCSAPDYSFPLRTAASVYYIPSPNRPCTLSILVLPWYMSCVCAWISVVHLLEKKNENKNNNNNDYDNNKEQKTHVSLDSRRTHSYVLAYRLRTIKKNPYT